MDVGTHLISSLCIQSFAECRVSGAILLSKSTAPYLPFTDGESHISHTLLSLDPPSCVVRSMGNTTRKAWQIRTASHEHLQATPCRGVLRSRLPRVVELQRPTVFYYSLVRPPFPSTTASRIDAQLKLPRCPEAQSYGD
jgi:hypothetical protein